MANRYPEHFRETEGDHEVEICDQPLLGYSCPEAESDHGGQTEQVPSQRHATEQCDPALQRKISTGESGGAQGMNETLKGFIEVVTKAATELCSDKKAEVAEVKRQYQQRHAQVVGYYEDEIKRLEAEIELSETENKLIQSSHKREVGHLKRSHERETASFREAMQSQAQQLKTSEAVRKKS